MLIPRSVEALHAFYEAQAGLGEPGGSNDNWITRAFNLGAVAWCVETVWTARLAAGFNTTGQILDFGTPANPPAWGINPLPTPDGVGFGSTYRQGSAYVWEEQRFAEAAGRWTTNFDEARPGDSVCVNHNGRGANRDPNSHLAEFIAWAPDGSAITWNGNVLNQICQARWSRGVIEGFCHPNFVTSPAPSQEDEMFSPSPHPARHLIAAHSGLVIGVSGTNAALGTQLVTEPSDGLLDQRWMPWGHPEGNMSFVCRDPAGKFWAIDVPDGNAVAGAKLRTWEFNATPAQRFTLDQVDPWLARIIHVSGLRVDVAYAGGDGAELQLWNGNDGRNQEFVFAPTV